MFGPTPGSKTKIGSSLFQALRLTLAQQNQAQKNIGLAGAIRDYIAGLTLSTAGSSTTFSVTAGVAVDSTNADVMTLAASISKTTGAWAAGTGNGALDTASIANSTWYHAYLIKNVSSRAVDVLVSLSASAPTLPSGYTLSRRIGAMKTNGSGQWTLFHQFGDEFLWDTPVADISTTTLGTTATLFALSVPTNVQVWARCRWEMTNVTANIAVLINSPDEAAQVVNTPTGNIQVLNPTSGIGAPAGELITRTNTSAQIRAVASAAGTNVFLVTYGWFDDRGKYA